MATRSTSLSFIMTAPTVAPQSFRHKDIGSDYVLLEWVTVPYGPIEGYKVCYGRELVYNYNTRCEQKFVTYFKISGDFIIAFILKVRSH